MRLRENVEHRGTSSNEALMSLAAEDGSENLDEAFGSCMPRLLRVADCILHNHHDSEDALQESLLSALRHLELRPPRVQAVRKRRRLRPTWRPG